MRFNKVINKKDLPSGLLGGWRRQLGGFSLRTLAVIDFRSSCVIRKSDSHTNKYGSFLQIFQRSFRSVTNHSGYLEAQKIQTINI